MGAAVSHLRVFSVHEGAWNNLHARGQIPRKSASGGSNSLSLGASRALPDAPNDKLGATGAVGTLGPYKVQLRRPLFCRARNSSTNQSSGNWPNQCPSTGPENNPAARRSTRCIRSLLRSWEPPRPTKLPPHPHLTGAWRRQATNSTVPVSIREAGTCTAGLLACEPGICRFPLSAKTAEDICLMSYCIGHSFRALPIRFTQCCGMLPAEERSGAKQFSFPSACLVSE